MKWSIQQLYRSINSPLEFSGEVDYSEYAKGVSDIIRMDIVKYSGSCRSSGDDRYEFDIKIKTTLYLEDARTLEEVPYEIDIDVYEIFTKDKKEIENSDDDIYYIEKNTVDLYDVIWEEILLEKPIRITKE